MVSLTPVAYLKLLTGILLINQKLEILEEKYLVFQMKTKENLFHLQTIHKQIKTANAIQNIQSK